MNQETNNCFDYLFNIFSTYDPILQPHFHALLTHTHKTQRNRQKKRDTKEPVNSER